MTYLRRFSVAGLVVVVSLVSLDAASARHRHHRVRTVDRTPRQFVFQSPAAAETTRGVGEFAGEYLPGILGATTADPYARPGYGYYAGGGRGPGYLYEGE